MDQETFEKLELDETATILDRLNPAFDGTAFDPVEALIMAADIPFYPGCRLLHISTTGAMPAIRRFAVYSPKDFTVLDFHNEAIYKFNETLPIKLNENNVPSYVRFYLTYVPAKHGVFQIFENIEDINWREDPPPGARQAVGKIIKPITLKEVTPEGIYKLEARMVFKDSLFKSEVEVKPSGLVSLSNEELLVEDLPVLDDTFGQ